MQCKSVLNKTILPYLILSNCDTTWRYSVIAGKKQRKHLQRMCTEMLKMHCKFKMAYIAFTVM